MKIGILTFHRSHNYGALLQAIALRTALTDMGHQVTFVDYWPPYHQHLYDLFSWASLKHMDFTTKLLYIAKVIFKYKCRKKRINSFEKFIAQYINPYVSAEEENYDLLIHGSDQIWARQREIRKFDPVYFGKNDIHANRQISYAASMGKMVINKDDDVVLRDYLSHLASISVRESELATLVEKCGYSCTVSADPTLLISGEKWLSLLNLPPKKKGGYVLFYRMLKKSFDEQQVKRFATQHNLSLKIVYGSATKKDTENEITAADPRKFVELLSGADFVFTSSYHGLVFAILFHKPFYASFSGNAGRAASLLKRLNITEHLLQPNAQIPLQQKEIDYGYVDSLIAEIQKESYKYLSDNTKTDNG